MVNMNVFRVVADLAHFTSKCVLIWAIHSNKSAEGVSLITQVLYVCVFTTRYLDLFWVSPNYSWWLFILKNFYIWSSIYIILLMTRVYARTREREKAWKLGGYAAGGSLLAAPLICLIFRGPSNTSFIEVLWTFSIVLESVCVLPQLLLLRQTTVPTVIDSFYLLLLGSYRALYILNWIIRGITEHYFDPIAVLFGIIQTALYLDFAWVYWTRQRVKLRGGAVVDSDDLRKGWLVNRVLGNQRAGSTDEEAFEPDAEDDVGNPTSRPANRWGARGISISADDTLLEHEQQPRSKAPPAEGNLGETQGILSPGGFESDEDDDAPILDTSSAAETVLNSGDAWGDPVEQVPNGHSTKG